MPTTNKIKALMNLKDASHADVAAALGVSKQAFSNKLLRDSFTADDLIKIADGLGCELAFIAKNFKIVLNQEEAKTPSK